MARSESRTKTAIWGKDEFRELTEKAQRVYWMLYSQSTISLCGVVALTVKRWANYSTDSTPEGITSSLVELETAGFVLVDHHTEEVFVRSFARHDGVQTNRNIWVGAWRALDSVASTRLRDAAGSELLKLGDRPVFLNEETACGKPPQEGASKAHRRPFEGASKGESRWFPPSPVPSPQSPSPSPPGVEPPPDGIGATHGTRGSATRELVQRVADACTAGNRLAVQREATELVAWARTAVDLRLVDEALGWAAKQAAPPVLPRALASVILRKARDSNIPMQPFKPTDRKSA